MAYGAAVVVRDRDGRVLLVRERYGGRDHFVPPGGTVEPGETPRDAAAREAHEECGVRISVGEFIGVYVSRADGWLAIAFEGRITGGEPTPQRHEGISDVGWFDLAALPAPVPSMATALLADVAAGRRGVYGEV